MNILVTDRVLASRDAFDALDDILAWVGRGRHEWGSRSSAIFDSPWLAEPGRISPRNKLFLQKAFRATTARPSGSNLTVIVDVVTQWPNVLDPARAQDCLEAPLHVVVENAVSDRAFMEAIARAYGADTLLCALERGHCVFVHAGGKGDIPKFAAGVRQKRMPRTENQLGDVARIYCLADSDRLAPEHVPQSVTDLRDALGRFHIPVHVLHKRDTENYLPVDALPSSGKRGRVRQAFLRLEASQRDHYDMKIGFETEKGKTVVPKEQAALFRVLSRPADLDELRGGFGKKVGERYGQEECRRFLTKDGFEAVCQTKRGELRELLESLEALL